MAGGVTGGDLSPGTGGTRTASDLSHAGMGGSGTGSGLGGTGVSGSHIGGTAQDYRSDHHLDVPHRPITPHDETIRAGQHHYAPDRRPFERHDESSLPMLALGVGAGLLAGWLLPRLVGSDEHRREWPQTRYGSQGRWREDSSHRGRESGYSSSTRHVATDETLDLISSSKVEGTAVYDRKGNRLGSVESFMVGKRSGRVAYAVMSFGGWLGLGESYHPLPWHMLTYDTKQGGYVVNLDESRLRNAPGYNVGQDASDAGYWGRVKNYWA